MCNPQPLRKGGLKFPLHLGEEEKDSARFKERCMGVNLTKDGL